MPTPYPVKFKLPLEFLTLQDWNNFVQNLLFINQYGPGKLLQYYQNGNFQNLDEVIAKYLYVSALKVAEYNVLHNLSEPQAYTFGEGNQQPFKTMSQKPTVNFPYSIPIKFVEFYPITKLPNYQFLVFPVEKLKVQLSAVGRQLQLLIPKLTSKIVTPNEIAGTQFQFSGTATVQTLIENYLDPRYLQTWREITIQNLGNSPVQINNSIYLMPKQYLKLTASSPSEVQLTAQTPTLLSEEIAFIGTPITTYTITITNSQSDPTPSPFQQLLNLNLSSLLSSSSQLLNLEFCLDVNCNTPLYAWIEQNSLSNAYIWVNLPVSIPANSSITIYMFVRNSVQYPYTGMAPYLSSTYAQYDNGGNVFSFYDNFAGTTLKSVWTVPSGSNYQVNNGFMAEPSADSTTAVYNPNIQETSSIIVEWSLNMSSTSYSSNQFWFQLNRYTSNSNIHMLGISGSDILYNNNTQINTASISSSGIQIFGIRNGGTTVTWYYEGNSYTDNSATTVTDYLALGWAYNGQSYNFPTIYWVRTRAYPPNGVMPSNSQPQKTIVLI